MGKMIELTAALTAADGHKPAAWRAELRANVG